MLMWTNTKVPVPFVVVPFVSICNSWAVKSGLGVTDWRFSDGAPRLISICNIWAPICRVVVTD
jgi:hypothetical protein